MSEEEGEEKEEYEGESEFPAIPMADHAVIEYLTEPGVSLRERLARAKIALVRELRTANITESEMYMILNSIRRANEALTLGLEEYAEEIYSDFVIARLGLSKSIGGFLQKLQRTTYKGTIPPPSPPETPKRRWRLFGGEA